MVLLWWWSACFPQFCVKSTRSRYNKNHVYINVVSLLTPSSKNSTRHKSLRLSTHVVNLRHLVQLLSRRPHDLYLVPRQCRHQYRHRPKQLTLTRLKVVARDQSHSPVATMHFGFPPPVILMTQHCKEVAFGEAQLFRNGGLVHVQSSCCYLVSTASLFRSLGLAENSPKCKMGRPSRVYCRDGSATLLLRCLESPCPGGPPPS